MRAGVATGFGEVAVVNAEGDIVDGEGDTTEVGGAKFAREIRQLREDSAVRAIVLRVNSPGGSATAAETMQRELRLARKSKPIIVSMGSYAASGGYWISAYGDRIFAEPTTITGSIGVFGIQFDIQRLANEHGFTFDTVKTGKYADSLTIARPKTDDELAVLQKRVDWIYDQFIAKVAEGRKLKPSFVEEIAQGRVWSGTEAKKLGLVDEIGGLSEAIKYAGTKIFDQYVGMTDKRSEHCLTGCRLEVDRDGFLVSVGRHEVCRLARRSVGVEKRRPPAARIIAARRVFHLDYSRT